MDGKRFIEIRKLPVEEVREIENTEQEVKRLDENKGSKVIEKLENTFLPTVYASDKEEEQKEGIKQTLGWSIAATDGFAPPVGLAESAVAGVGGAITEGAGKITGNEDAKNVGEVLKEAPLQPLKDTGKTIKKIFE